MHLAFRASILSLLPLWVSASPRVSCSLDYNGDEAVMPVLAESNALGGSWKDMGQFKVRALLSAPANRRPWLLVEVYAHAADGDFRIISSQKVFAPFATGRMEVVEPRLGRSLRYECGEVK